MSVMVWQDHMTGSGCLQNGGIKVKLDPIVADAFAELYASTSSLEVERLSRLLNEERERRERLEGENARLRDELESVGTAAYLYGRSDLKAENSKLRKLAQDLLLNLRNRETILELVGLPLTEAQKAAMTALSNTCNELGVEGADE